MRKEIEEFKKNSTVTYTVKEMLGGIDIKLCRMEQRLIDGDKKFASIETSIKWHKRLILSLYGVLGAFLIKPARSIITKIFGG